MKFNQNSSEEPVSIAYHDLQASQKLTEEKSSGTGKQMDTSKGGSKVDNDSKNNLDAEEHGEIVIAT